MSTYDRPGPVHTPGTSPGTTYGEGVAYTGPAPIEPNEPSTTDVAREQAGAVGQQAKEATGQVAQTAKEEARAVAAEAKAQARDLLGEARAQGREQAVAQRDKATQGLYSLSDELSSMASSGNAGVASELARQAADKSRDLARFLESREPGDLVEDLRSFARRRPGAFLAGAAIAGVLAGRLVRGAAAQQSDESGTGAPGTPYRPATADTGYGTGFSTGYQPGAATTGTGYTPTYSGESATPPAVAPIVPETTYGTSVGEPLIGEEPATQRFDRPVTP